jgi:hypothetical protein
MKICPVGGEFYVGRLTDRRTDRRIDRRTDRFDDANSRFSQSYELAYKFTSVSNPSAEKILKDRWDLSDYHFTSIKK